MFIRMFLDDDNRLATSYSNKTYTGCCYELNCRHQLVNNVLLYVQTISDLLEQLVASLLASSTVLQGDNNLF
jgi:hypothetical protein